MFDKLFIAEMGMSNLPSEKINSLINLATEELERRVGNKLMENMSEEEVRQYWGIESEDTEVLRGWLEKFQNYSEDPVFIKMKEALSQKNGHEMDLRYVVKEYLKMQFLEKNAPNFREVVNDALGQIKQELLDNKDRILYSML